jgi:hypothetical protein
MKKCKHGKSDDGNCSFCALDYFYKVKWDKTYISFDEMMGRYKQDNFPKNKAKK